MIIVAVVTGRGVGPLFWVPPNCKINSTYYITYILKPLVDDFLPKIYPGELNKVFVHHDKASSHVSRLTTDYMTKVTKDIGIQFIDKGQIPVKSPDASPLDVFGFGYIKQKLRTKRPKTLVGMCKVAQELWYNIPSDVVDKVFQDWRRRLNLMCLMHGEQIEPFKHLHHRVVYE